MSYLYQFVCPGCLTTYELFYPEFVCKECGSILLFEYDLYKARRELHPNDWSSPKGVWTFKQLLPVYPTDPLVTFREGNTPILELKKSSKRLSVEHIYLKNEAQNPGGSARDREMTVLFTYLQKTDYKTFMLESTGTSGISASMYCRLIDGACNIIMPDNYPIQLRGECQLFGSNVTLTTWNESNRLKVKENIQAQKKMFDISREGMALRIEGAKTIFFELFLHFRKSFPQVLLVPCGEGVTLLGIWKAIVELQKLGWLHKTQLPKIWIVQSHHCPSLLKRDEEEEYTCEDTIAFDLYHKGSPLHALITRLMRDHGWSVVTVDDEDTLSTWKQIAKEEGLLLSPEGSICLAALAELIRSGKEKRNQSFLILNPSNGTRFIHSLGFIKRNKVNH